MIILYSVLAVIVVSVAFLTYQIWHCPKESDLWETEDEKRRRDAREKQP